MAQILIGISMIALTVAIHAIGSSRWLGVVGRWHSHRRSAQGTAHLTLTILSTGMVLLTLHIVEAMLWALLYWRLPSHSGLSSIGDSVYLSLVTFTTLGYGDVTLGPKWELLGPMEALAGITVIGLTTALLFAVIQQSWKIGHAKKS